MYYESVETIGIELELENLRRSSPEAKKISNLGFKLVSDASIQSKIPTFKNIPFYTTDSTIKQTINAGIEDYGVEVISDPINPKSLKFTQSLDKLCNIAYPIEGETSLSDRASLHVHVCVGDSLNLHQLKSIIRWATRLESFFYRFGSFGKEFRGYTYDYTYCRPLTGRGPSVIEDVNSRTVQTMNTADLLSSDTVEDFWYRYCDVLHTMDSKYHPVRYMWLNLFSIFKHKTLEFRVFNLSLNPYEIRSAIHLCQAVTHTMLNTSYKKLKELELSPINNLVNPNESESMEALNYILDDYPIGDPTFDDMIRMIFNKSEYPRYSNDYVWSHVYLKNGGSFFRDTNRYTPPAITGDIKKPNYIDIHDRRSTVDNVPTKFNRYIK